MDKYTLKGTLLKHYLDGRFRETDDSKFQVIEKNNEQIELIYLKSVCDTDKIQLNLVKPFFEMQHFEQYVQSLEGYSPFESNDQTVEKMLRGHVVMLTTTAIYLIDIKKAYDSDVLETIVETTIQGPRKGLSENIETNINLIRHRYHKSSLIVEKVPHPGGKDTRMNMMIVYDEEIASKEIINQVKQHFKKIDKDFVQAVSQIQRAFTRTNKSLFPLYMVTERPDRIAYNLTKGKVVVFLEGTPFVLIAPAVFFDFMSSMEDLYQPYWISQFLIVLRYIGLLISVILPAFYVGVTSYNPELFRVQLALSIAGSRIGVPYPSYLEILFMLLMMELLIESSIRLPKTIGPTATTVGGLILGQAATDAGLVSNIMIIIVSLVAIADFVIPSNQMSFAIRVVKYPILLLATLFGLIGMVVGVVGLIFYLIHLNSFGEPYFRFFYSELPKEAISKKG